MSVHCVDSTSAEIHLFHEPAGELVDENPEQGSGAVNIGRTDHQIQIQWALVMHQIGDKADEMDEKILKFIRKMHLLSPAVLAQ